MKNVAFTLVMLPPHTSVLRNWAARVAQDEIGVRVLQPETIEDAVRHIAEADAAFGTMPPEVLRAARRLRWLQAPQIAPPAGFFTLSLSPTRSWSRISARSSTITSARTSWPLYSPSRGAFTTTCRSKCVVSTRPGRMIPALCICPKRPPSSSASEASAAKPRCCPRIRDARHRR